ncbi:hypothetical protein [Pseudonocardia alaniniphila]|uniref:Uncharacterized protein n=1 Tax=Pseudonocardia alaniniphila TaxID=75291 RepID=A0ABS9TL22_9PSEU|nr:hypothetical protein [Pseudonocardia alaniniphila]MCH6169247.1 hypothetical protein [Pseudonocardia alaniniphila]
MADEVDGEGGNPPHVTQPAWKRQTRGEHRWPAAAAVVVAIVLQLMLPNPVVPQARYVLPVLEVVLLIGLGSTPSASTVSRPRCESVASS